MTDFYNQLLHGASKVRALRHAQAAVRERFPDPSDWAAFELTGDPGPTDHGSFREVVARQTALIAAIVIAVCLGVGVFTTAVFYWLRQARVKRNR